MTKKTPAHKTLIDQFLNWELVQERLSRYEHIGIAYPFEFLQSCSNTSPYYCHYLAWRLGTWNSDEFFRYFNDLLDYGSSLQNWANNKNLIRSCNYDDFWGLLWQLQVAKFFSEQEISDITWMKAGPDLKIHIGKQYFFAECYTYRKSFALSEFIEELFFHVHPHVRVSHTSCLKFSLPRKGASDIEYFLDELFNPYLYSDFLESKLQEARVEYPVPLPIPKGAVNFSIYLEGPEHSKYIPSTNAAGPPELYLEHVITEAINNKRKENQLHAHHPNLLVVNCSLDTDFQIALNRQLELGIDMPVVDLGNEFDGVLITACGIDENLSKSGFIMTTRQDHPVRNF